MFAMMKTGKMERFMKDLEILGLLVACVSKKKLIFYDEHLSYLNNFSSFAYVLIKMQ